MKTKAILSEQAASRILEAAIAEAKREQWAVAVAVVDDGGHLLSFARLDDCAPVGAYIAIEKARTAALGRRESKVYEDMINGGRAAFLSAPVLSATLTGGVPVVHEGQVIGAVGVSGVKPDQDAQVAHAGANADPG